MSFPCLLQIKVGPIQPSRGIGTDSRAVDWEARAHFVTTPVSLLGNWITQLLKQWPSALDQAIVQYPEGATRTIKRLDGRWPWMQPIDQILGDSFYPVANVGDGCDDSQIPTNMTGQLALMSRSQSANCSLSERLLRAQHAGAVGIVMYSGPGEALVDLNCRKISCYAVVIPVTMIPYSEGTELIHRLAQGESIQMGFTETITWGRSFAIDCNSELQEMGNFQYPSMSFLAWEAQYFDYYRDMLNTVTASTVPGTSDFVVNVYDSTVMNGPTNSTLLTFPAPSTLNQYDQLLLDMELGCPGPKDSSCPAWDRILSVYICCGDVNSDVVNNGTTGFCGQELGRWITPFARRVGRWLTDVTPLLPLFSAPQEGASSTQCGFQISCGTTENWVPTLNLRFHNQQASDPHPTHILPLFEGGTFDSSYNDRYSPIQFDVPSGTTRVLLYAVITGHGSDNNGCGEFCVTSHHFMFNNQTTDTRTFWNAGTPLGCAHRASEGVEPNEYGTWLYGRDGWCDGQEVKPWIVDVTAQVVLGTSNTVLYYGWYDGATPDPTENPGYIVMYSYLSFYSS